ncbi:MAG: hypothetical protein WC326_04570 [Candidatus Delongbacteria bacterium]
MNKRLTIVLALALTGAAFAAESETTERRVDTETYEILRTSQPATGGAVVALPGSAAEYGLAPAPTGPLAELRARQLAEFQSLAASLGAADNQAREALEDRLRDLKLRHSREELEFLRQDALSRGDAAYAARLDEALGNLTPRPAPAPTTFVPRDPATGRALDGTEGGAR